MKGRAPKNPSTLVFWNDLENDEKLKTCSLAAKGLWDHHMLPMAARSSEVGVVILGNHPSRVDDDLPALLARAVGESPDTIRALLRELVDSEAASVDDRGRIYNRRMVREESIRKARSEAGKAGAAATNAGRQKSGKGVGKAVDGDSDKMGGKSTTDETDLNAQQERTIRREEEQNARQTSDEMFGGQGDETALSSILHASDSNDLTTSSTEVANGTGVPGATLLATAVEIWNEAAERVGWSKVQRVTGPRRKALKARLKECDGLDGWRAAIERATASAFLTGKTKPGNGHENWRCDFDFIIREAKFTKLMEGGYDDRPGSTNRVQSNLGANLQALAEFGREGSG